MNLPAIATDNVTELLIKIIEFSQARQKILIKNINLANNKGFVPKDLPAEEFSCVLNTALDSHIDNQHLVLQDTENVKFGSAGNFEVNATEDKCSLALLKSSRDEYFELQVKKLFENSLSQRAAAEMLKHKQKSESPLY